MKFVSPAVLVILFIASLSLWLALRTLPLKELRRRARGGGDHQAAAVYKLAAYGPPAEVLLWLVGGLAFGGLVVIAIHAVWWAGLVAVLVAGWLARPRQTYHPKGWAWTMAAWLAPATAKLTGWLQPLLNGLAHLLSFRPPAASHHIYEREDLLDMLSILDKRQDHRLADKDIKSARGVLAFQAKIVGQAMTPRRDVKWLPASETIGPTLMDELHKTGASRFAVVKQAPASSKVRPDVIGTVYLPNLLARLEKGGHVSDAMAPGAYYVNEAQNLRDCLDAFQKTGAQLLIVVNNFEEIAGIVTLEQVLTELFGQPIDGQFDEYGDLVAVAGYEPPPEEPPAAQKDDGNSEADELK